MSELADYVDGVLDNAVCASRVLAKAGGKQKDDFLLRAAGAVLEHKGDILKANSRDIRAAESAGLAPSLVDRLKLDEGRLQKMADALRNIAALRDPVGEVISGWTRPNGLRIEKVRVPIGVICMIYEARPDVTADAAALCIKSGNAAVLRGGKEALNSNLAIHRALAEALRPCGLDPNCAQIINTPDRAAVDLLLAAEGRLDLVIPRGGEGLIRAVAAKSKVPVIKHYKGVCHTYVDAGADLDLAEKVCLNAKLQRPAVCNAMETLLVHKDVAQAFLPRISEALLRAGCELRGCERSRAMVAEMKPAAEEDWSEEYNDLVLSVRVVDSIAEAIGHIARYGSQHSDAIITRDLASAERFALEVDSCGVFVNCSTRFNDGGEFGMGAEIGISTDKLHARGPMALPELTIYKYLVRGDGQVRE